MIVHCMDKKTCPIKKIGACPWSGDGYCSFDDKKEIRKRELTLQLAERANKKDLDAWAEEAD